MSEEVQITKEFVKRTFLVVFDLDKTILTTHTNGIVYKSPTSEGICVDEIHKYISPAFKQLVPKLLKMGVLVGISSFTDKSLADDESKIYYGEELIRLVLQIAFPEDYLRLLELIFITTWCPEEKISKTLGKNNHIARIWEKILVYYYKKVILKDSDEFKRKMAHYNKDYLEEVFKTVLPMDNSEEIPNLRSLIVSGTLLVDDDKCNIYPARTYGYQTLYTECGLTVKEWNKFVCS